MVSGRSDVVDVLMHVHHRTERAILVSDDNDRETAVWLPLSQIEIEDGKVPGTVLIAMPEWLALQEGLI